MNFPLLSYTANSVLMVPITDTLLFIRNCSDCVLFPLQSQALAHYKGTKHAKKLKAHGTPKTRLKGSAVAKETAKQENAKGINTSQSPNDAERKGEELFLYRLSCVIQRRQASVCCVP